MFEAEYRSEDVWAEIADNDEKRNAGPQHEADYAQLDDQLTRRAECSKRYHKNWGKGNFEKTRKIKAFYRQEANNKSNIRFPVEINDIFFSSDYIFRALSPNRAFSEDCAIPHCKHTYIIN